MQIKNIDMAGPMVHSLINSDIAQMSLAWPSLQSLAIALGNSGTLDLRALYLIGRQFPLLESLSLPLNLNIKKFSIVQVMGDSKYSIAHSLMHLNVNKAIPASFEDPLITSKVYKIGQVLDAVFPNLDTANLGSFVRGLQGARRREWKICAESWD
ncbi:hypothetical protein BJ165DRAFT_194681 [Panaeolus papilionaceus]|nr:hypothetical protein BJ165DRAFT_194681 [Panaeolus papilionaceus]